MTSVLFAFLLLAAGDAASLSNQAQDLAGQGRPEEAEKLWRRAVELQPDFFPALFNLGYLKSSQENYTEAITWLDRAARAKPSDFNTDYLLGQGLSKLNRRDDALRAWRAALAIQPANVKLMRIMIVEYSKGRYFQEAAVLAARAIQLKPGDLDSYLFAIHAYQDARDFAAGLAVARRAAERFPDAARANFEYAFHLQVSGNAEQSRVYLEKAMAEDKGYEEPFFFYGDQLVAEGQDERAIPYLHKAIGIRNDYVEARIALATALIHLEKWPAAIAQLEETIRLNAARPEPHLLLSRILFRLGEEARARVEAQTSLRLRRENPELLETPQGRPFAIK